MLNDWKCKQLYLKCGHYFQIYNKNNNIWVEIYIDAWPLSALGPTGWADIVVLGWYWSLGLIMEYFGKFMYESSWYRSLRLIWDATVWYRFLPYIIFHSVHEWHGSFLNVLLCSLTGGNLLQPVGGGKPLHLAGKPLTQARGQLVQITGKGAQQLIQTPQGALPISIIPQGGGAAGVMTLGQPRTPPGKHNWIHEYYKYCKVFLKKV